jgi:hypothetical protein
MGIFDSLAGAGLSAGINAATGNWIGAGISLVGGLMGAFGSSSAAKQSQQISQTINTEEGLVNDQHEQAMLLASQRQNIQTLRQAQQARALGLARATNQNAAYGSSSGYKGGQSQIESEAAFNIQGVNQNTEIGEKIFGLDRLISQNKLALQNVQSNYQSGQALDQGISSFGNFVSKSGDPLSRLLNQFGPSSS